jgi:hypothetical protein
MANGNKKNYVSVWFWMFALFIMALPCIGFIMVIVWAFTGDNESRKNYFRAIIAWALILTALWIGLMTFGFGVGFWPEIQKQIQFWIQHRK